MKVHEGASLERLNSFRVPARAALLAEIESEEDLFSLPSFNPARDYVLGEGSNVLFLHDVPGVLYRVRIPGKSIVAEDGDTSLVEVGAGENWHGLVRWSLEQGLSGLENLSLIPGQVGAAPFQNIGAYGAELADVLESVTAWEWRTAGWRVIPVDQCGLAYRDSRFKSGDRNRFLITSVRLRLHRVFEANLSYSGLSRQLSAMGVSQPAAVDVSDAVMALRQSKLPDPAREPNAGSFFKNPVIGRDRADRLKSRIPQLASWPNGTESVKISAAQLIEASGLKGLRQGNAAISEKHALVLVNLGSASGADIARLARHVENAVYEQWGVQLEPEIQMIQFENAQ